MSIFWDSWEKGRNLLWLEKGAPLVKTTRTEARRRLTAAGFEMWVWFQSVPELPKRGQQISATSVGF